MKKNKKPKLDEPLPRIPKLPKGQRVDPKKFGNAGLRVMIDNRLFATEGMDKKDWQKLGPQALVILRAILQEKEGTVAQMRRDQAILTLGILKDQRSLQELSKILDSPNESKRSRMRAAYSLGCLENKKASDVLTKNLKERNPSIRRQVVDAIGKIGGKDRLKKLETIFRKDRSMAIKAAAFDAIKRIEEREDVPKISASLKRPRTTRTIPGKTLPTKR